MNSRAALDAARVVLDPFLRVGGSVSADAPPDVSVPSRTAVWNTVEMVLQTMVDDASLRGQRLISDARRLQRLSIAEAHALVALLSWSDSVETGSSPRDVTPSDTDRAVVGAAWQSLEAAVQRHDVEPAHSPAPSPSPVRAAPAGGTAASQVAAPPQRAWYSRPGTLVGAIALVVVLVGAAATWATQRGRARDEGISAYTRGDLGAARAALAEYITQYPDDAMALMYLGRIVRESHDLPLSRRLLERAARVSPQMADVQRELAATLLASGELELARMRYVRAVELDPTDRLAAGFLACTLHRLGRDNDATRWAARAGAGEWSACLSAAPAVPSLHPELHPDSAT